MSTNEHPEPQWPGVDARKESGSVEPGHTFTYQNEPGYQSYFDLPSHANLPYSTPSERVRHDHLTSRSDRPLSISTAPELGQPRILRLSGSFDSSGSSQADSIHNEDTDTATSPEQASDDLISPALLPPPLLTNFSLSQSCANSNEPFQPGHSHGVSSDSMALPPPALPLPGDILGPQMRFGHDDDEEDHDKRGRTVRFHSRVRISSGFHHDVPSLSRSSSCSGSSSISAPLRSTPEDRPPPIKTSKRSARPSQTSLSQIMSSDQASAWLLQQNLASKRRNHYPNSPINRRVQARLLSHIQTNAQNEGSPLNGRRKDSAKSPNYVRANGGIARTQMPSPSAYYNPHGAQNGHYGEYPAHSDDGEGEEVQAKTEVDVIYGAWPGRLLNHQWWRWKAEGVLCCFSSSD